MAATAVAREFSLCTPQREIAQAAALAALVLAEGGAALRGHSLVEELLQHLQLGLEDGIAVDLFGRPVALAELGGELGDVLLKLRAELFQLRNILDADVNRVDETPRGGQVRRILHRRDWLARVQRVDKEEVIIRRQYLRELG